MACPTFYVKENDHLLKIVDRIYSHRKKMSYDDKMDAYVLMRNNKDKGDKREDSKKTNVEEMEKKAEIERGEGELGAWRKGIRIERRDRKNCQRVRGKDLHWRRR